MECGVGQLQLVELVSLDLCLKLAKFSFLFLLQSNVPVYLILLMEEWLSLEELLEAQLPTPAYLATLWVDPLVVLVSLMECGVDQFQSAELVSLDWCLMLAKFSLLFLLQSNVPVYLTLLMEEWLSLEELLEAQLPTPAYLATLWVDPLVVLVSLMECGVDQLQSAELVSLDWCLMLAKFSLLFLLQSNVPVYLILLMEEWLSLEELLEAQLPTPVTLATIWGDPLLVLVCLVECGVGQFQSVLLLYSNLVLNFMRMVLK